MTRTARLTLTAALLGACQVAPSVGALRLGDLPNLVRAWEDAWSGVPMRRVISDDRYDFGTVQADRLEGHARSFGPGGHQGVVTLRQRPA